MQVVVVTPEKTELKASVNSLIVPLFDGLMGILPGRAPMIGRLGFGVLTLRTGAESSEHYVDGGFVQVTGSSVYILTDRLLDPKKLDPKQVAEEMQKALTMSGATPEQSALKERALAQARAKSRLAS